MAYHAIRKAIKTLEEEIRPQVEDSVTLDMAAMALRVVGVGPKIPLRYLHHMEGHPIYIVRKRGGTGRWDVVDRFIYNGRLLRTAYNVRLSLSDYGRTWEAYAYKPALPKFEIEHYSDKVEALGDYGETGIVCPGVEGLGSGHTAGEAAGGDGRTGAGPAEISAGQSGLG